MGERGAARKAARTTETTCTCSMPAQLDASTQYGTGRLNASGTRSSGMCSSRPAPASSCAVSSAVAEATATPTSHVSSPAPSHSRRATGTAKFGSLAANASARALLAAPSDADVPEMLRPTRAQTTRA